MAQADLDQFLQAITTSFSESLSRAMLTLGELQISSNIPYFSGETGRFKTWLSEIEKLAVIFPEFDKKKCIAVAYHRSQGEVCAFIKRYISDHPNSTYEEFRSELAQRFSPPDDKSLAFHRLKGIKQRSNESVTMFGERLLTISREAFEPAALSVVEPQLIGFFVDGLIDARVRESVLRAKPDTLRNALKASVDEIFVQTRLGYRSNNPNREITPMEIDKITPAKKCRICNRTNHKTSDCRSRSAYVHVVDRKAIKCYHCGKLGHIRRQCYKFLKEQQEASQRDSPRENDQGN